MRNPKFPPDPGTSLPIHIEARQNVSVVWPHASTDFSDVLKLIFLKCDLERTSMFFGREV